MLFGPIATAKILQLSQIRPDGKGPELFGHGLSLGQLNVTRHLWDIKQRHVGDYRPYHAGRLMEKERGIFRTLNACESTLGFALLAPHNLLALPWPVLPRWTSGGSADSRILITVQTGTHAILYFLAHRIISRSDQGESLWQLVQQNDRWTAVPLEEMMDSSSSY